jgi:hypothetical protein
MWKKFFEKPKTPIYKGAFGMGSNPNREAICVQTSLGGEAKGGKPETPNCHYCRALCGCKTGFSPKEKCVHGLVKFCTQGLVCAVQFLTAFTV